MDDITSVRQAKEGLLRLSNENMNSDYTYILETLDNYLIEHCNHNVVTDLIDIDPEISQTIHYCDRCMLTFTSNK
jgi:hypothetical protein